MVDPEFLVEAGLDCRLDVFEVIPAVLGDYDVGIERRTMLLHLPEMCVMNFLDSVHVLHGRDNLVRVDIGRASQHQGADRATDLAEGEPEDIGGNPDGDRRINPADIVEKDENATEPRRPR